MYILNLTDYSSFALIQMRQYRLEVNNMNNTFQSRKKRKINKINEDIKLNINYERY